MSHPFESFSNPFGQNIAQTVGHPLRGVVVLGAANAT